MANQIKRYRISAIKQDAQDVFQWYLSPNEGQIFEYKPGQFAMIHLFNDDCDVWKKKPYSMSSSPTQKECLEFGVKIHGDFTQKMASLTVNDIVGIEGPYGFFTYDKEKLPDLVIFSGGIGITPFVSMIRYAGQEARENKILMFYCNQTEHDIAYRRELEESQKQNKNLTIIYSVDQTITHNWKGEVGLIDDAKITKHISNFQSKMYYMCGPVPFMKKVESLLHAHGVPNAQIKREVF